MTAFQNTTVTKDAVIAKLRAQVAGDMLAHLDDLIFEGLPTDKAKEWPRRVLLAVTPGSDLSHVPWQFLHWLLTDSEVNPGIDDPTVKDAVRACADVLVPLTRGNPLDASAAESAAQNAERAAESAARSAATAASAAWSAAESAAYAAWSAAESASIAAASAAAAAARSAERSAESAAWSAERVSWSAARSAAYVMMSDKLVELIEAAPKGVQIDA